MPTGGGDSDVTIKYADYIHDAHKFLIQNEVYGGEKFVKEILDMDIYGSPYYDYAQARPDDDPARLFPYPDIDDAMFSVGYTITSFPSLWDMYGKFVAGLDIEVLYEQIYEDMVNDPAINAAIGAEATYLDDESNRTSIPKITAGMRDLNAVMSSSFIYAKALIESDKLKMISKFSAALKMRAMELAVQRWAKHLEWNHNTVEQYMRMQQLFWGLRQEWVDKVTEMAKKDKLWPFEVLDCQRIIIATLNGAQGAVQPPKIPVWQQVMSNVLGVAGIAAMIAGI